LKSPVLRPGFFSLMNGQAALKTSVAVDRQKMAKIEISGFVAVASCGRWRPTMPSCPTSGRWSDAEGRNQLRK
jgi:hypothetical protein